MSRLTLAELVEAAKSETFRWTAARKAVVVEAVQQGNLSQGDIARRFGISGEEFGGWRQQIEQHGLGGLRATRLQDYKPERRQRSKSSGPENWDCAAPSNWQGWRALLRQRFG